MDTQLLEKHFSRIGARVKISEIVPGRWQSNAAGIDILQDKTGEFFDIRLDRGEAVEYEVVDLEKPLRHLLLMARREAGKEKFLCGHDERHWFVCAVPGKTIVTVENAMEALQPEQVRRRVSRNVKRKKNRLARRNEAFVRQGEWFFVPFPNLFVATYIRRNEPISRGPGSKPHVCEEVYRSRGEAVMVCDRYPTPILHKHFNAFLKSRPKAKNWNWRQMTINASVYARGAVRHPDHKTIRLDGWHQILMNTEAEAPGARHIFFLD